MARQTTTKVIKGECVCWFFLSTDRSQCIFRGSITSIITVESLPHSAASEKELLLLFSPLVMLV